MTNTLHLLASSSATTALDAARSLLANGANACSRSEDGLTPLHVACAYDCLAMAQLLMHYGADPLAQDNHGRTPFSMASGNTQRFLQRMLAKSTRERRGIIRRLFAFHTMVRDTTGGSLLRSFRKKMRRSLNIVRRRPRHVAYPVCEPATSAFGEIVPSRPTQTSPSLWTISSDRSTVPGYPSFDTMPQSSFSKAHHVVWRTSKGAGGKVKFATVAEHADQTKKKRSHSDPELKALEGRHLTTPRSVHLAKSYTAQRCRDREQTTSRMPLQCSFTVGVDHREPGSKTPKDGQTRAVPSAPPIEEMLDEDASKWLSEKDSSQDSQSAYVTADESLDAEVLERRLNQIKLVDAVLSPHVDDSQQRRARRLTDAQLRAELKKYGVVAGPMCARTRGMYEKKLVALKRDAAQVRGIRYSRQLEMAMLDISRAESGKALDEEVREEFKLAGVSAFCYLLLDPRKITVEIETIDLKTFVPAIFYVGKGSKARPLAHLIEAKKEKEGRSPKLVSNAKLQRIDSIWESGLGVVCLQINQNVSDDEAFVREAALIEAIKLENLTNMKCGEWRGKSKSWTMQMRAEFGTYQLLRAMGVLKMEGIRPIFPQALPDAIFPWDQKKHVQR